MFGNMVECSLKTLRPLVDLIVYPKCLMADSTKNNTSALSTAVLAYKYPSPSPFHIIYAPSFSMILEWEWKSDLGHNPHKCTHNKSLLSFMSLFHIGQTLIRVWVLYKFKSVMRTPRATTLFTEAKSNASNQDTYSYKWKQTMTLKPIDRERNTQWVQQ
jgi:hypothetical protein